MKGKVIDLQQNNLLKVEIIRSEACGKCKGCLAGMSKKEMELEAKNLCEAEIGDWVELELQDNVFFKAVIISYGIPFIAFILGVVLGEFVFAPLLPTITEGLVAFITGFVGVFLAYGWIKSQNKRWESGTYTPLATRLADEFD
ncbi:MAG: SoxR reducing system RseC family protein [Bacillota bacterium]